MSAPARTVEIDANQIVVDDFNPRYVLYAYPLPPAVRMEKDQHRWLGGCMTGFLGWINQRWNEFDQLMGWNYCDPEARSDEAMFWFDMWLLAKVTSTQGKDNEAGGVDQGPG